MTDLQEFFRDYASIVELLYSQWESTCSPSAAAIGHVCTPACKQIVLGRHSICEESGCCFWCLSFHPQGNLHICTEEFCDYLPHAAECPVTGTLLWQFVSVQRPDPAPTYARRRGTAGSVLCRYHSKHTKVMDQKHNLMIEEMQAKPEQVIFMKPPNKKKEEPTRVRFLDEYLRKQASSEQLLFRAKASPKKKAVSKRFDLLKEIAKHVQKPSVATRIHAKIETNFKKFMEKRKTAPEGIVTEFLSMLKDGLTVEVDSRQFKVAPKLRNIEHYLKHSVVSRKGTRELIISFFLEIARRA